MDDLAAMMLSSSALGTTIVVMVILFGVTGIATWASYRIERSVIRIGDRYEELFLRLKAEILAEVRQETSRNLSQTRALVVEHSELEALLALIREHRPTPPDPHKPTAGGLPLG